MDLDDELIGKYEQFYTILNKTIGGYTVDEFRKARNDYLILRSVILSNSELRPKMPLFILDCHTLDEFSKFIKSKGDTGDRRIYLKKELQPANAFVYHILATPGDEAISETLSHRTHLMDTWEKALKRRAADPDGAITSARTLLESTFKHVLDEKSISYSDDGDLQPLYELASKAINLHPNQHSSNPGLQQLLGGCRAAILAIGSIRNAQGDAHGRSDRDIKPERRLSALSVNLAGSLASYFLSTLDDSET